MSAYELDLRKQYEAEGWEFVFDTVSGSNVAAIVRKFTHQLGAKLGDVMAVQGECMKYDARDQKGYSKWLIMRRKSPKK